jgi:starch synthase (maltosyl-transferring)
MSGMRDEAGRQRVVIEKVTPEIDGGRFPIKRVVGEKVVVEADAFTDGHDGISCRLLFRPLVQPQGAAWSGAPMQPLPDDRWRGSFAVGAPGRWRYTVTGWVDHFKTWRRDLAKRVEEGRDPALDPRLGAGLIRGAGQRAEAAGRKAEARILAGLAQNLEAVTDPAARLRLALDDELSLLMDRFADRRFATVHRELEVVVDRERARFSSWYEMFPRSAGAAGSGAGSALVSENRHGTFQDAEALLPYVARMGFDVLYLPPIHPIGTTFRKGKNNAAVAAPGDAGSPWAVGAPEGGHTAVHPELGTLEDFRRFRAKAEELGIEIALDLAWQVSPDHPYVKEHPDWLQAGAPSGHQDIIPFDFEAEGWRDLWRELKGVVDHWIAQGVRLFGVDNPHMHPFLFWEWLIREVKREHPDVLFLSGAFARPKVLAHLAKLGFTWSNSYFPWRNTRQELYDDFTELGQAPRRDFFRPILWPNTPDILPEPLQTGGRPAFVQRLILAATLGASYGIYGPAFELMENVPKASGSEEYRDAERYQLRAWDLARPDSLRELIALVNKIRRESPALQTGRGLRFHPTDNDQILCYSKVDEKGDDTMLVAVNLDLQQVQSAWVELPVAELGLPKDQPYQVHDLLTGARYLWHGSRNFVQLDPFSIPAHIFRVRRRVRTERDFDSFL